MELDKSNSPHLIIVTGIPGSGKSYFCEKFSESFKAPLVSEEQIRNKLFADKSYGTKENQTVDNVVNMLLDELLKTNKTIIYRGNTDQKNTRAELYKKCKQFGYIPMLIWVQTDQATAKKRFIKKLNVNTSTEIFDNKFTKFCQPSQNEKPLVISGKHPYSNQLKIVLQQLLSNNSSLSNSRQTERYNFIR